MNVHGHRVHQAWVQILLLASSSARSGSVHKHRSPGSVHTVEQACLLSPKAWPLESVPLQISCVTSGKPLNLYDPYIFLIVNWGLSGLTFQHGWGIAKPSARAGHRDSTKPPLLSSVQLSAQSELSDPGHELDISKKLHYGRQ